ncbi:MAG: hypothetical protein ACI4RA_11390 [Kiritimatiellia bacterium]
MKELTPMLPTAAEIETIIPIIKQEFKTHGLEITTMGPHPYGGLVAEARIPIEKIREMRNALFAHGIILVSAQAGWGFAVLH